MTKFPSNIRPLLSLVSYNVHANVWQLCLFSREFPIAPMMNPSLKSRFMQKFSRFSRIKKFGH